jgi:hypothetical protein
MSEKMDTFKNQINDLTCRMDMLTIVSIPKLIRTAFAIEEGSEHPDAPSVGPIPNEASKDDTIQEISMLENMSEDANNSNVSIDDAIHDISDNLN